MRKYFEIVRTQTAKPMGRTTQGFSAFNRDVQEFESLEDVKKWLKSEYYNCKTTQKIYRDGRQGEPLEVGKIYSYKVKEQDGNYYQQDWIEIREVKKDVRTILV